MTLHINMILSAKCMPLPAVWCGGSTCHAQFWQNWGGLASCLPFPSLPFPPLPSPPPQLSFLHDALFHPHLCFRCREERVSRERGFCLLVYLDWRREGTRPRLLWFSKWFITQSSLSGSVKNHFQTKKWREGFLREDFLSQRKWTARRMTRLRLPPWLHLAAMNSTPQELVTSTLFNHNTSICITYGVWVLMRSWYHIWDFFLCKSSSIRRNYGTLSLALENLQWTNRYHQTSF